MYLGLHFVKKIQLLVEEDPRFSPFDLAGWRRNWAGAFADCGADV